MLSNRQFGTIIMNHFSTNQCAKIVTLYRVQLAQDAFRRKYRGQQKWPDNIIRHQTNQ